jgi:O-antigen ligase
MGNAAPMGLSTALTLPLGLVLTSQILFTPSAGGRWRLAQVLVVLGVALVAIGAYMTYNRASWLAIVITVVLLALLRPRMRRMLLPVFAGALLLAVIFWPAITQSAVFSERLLEDNSLGYRTTALNLALTMVRHDPLFGVGYYNFGSIAKEVYGWDPFKLFGIYPPAHNSYSFLLVSGGLLVLLPYLAWIILLAWGGIKRYRVLGKLPPSLERGQAQDALAAGMAMLLSYAVASATFDNGDHFIMNVIVYMAIGAIWGATEGDGG